MTKGMTSNFQTMPLRFRVWDKVGKYFILENADLDTYASLWAGAGVGGDDEIVSQDTGLKDKNGKNIYTGDIIKRGGDDKFTTVEYIVWSPESGGVDTLRSPDDKFPTSLCQGDSPYIEVIGNIWENPELLEEQA